MNKNDFKREIEHLMLDYLSDFELNYSFNNDTKSIYVELRNKSTSKSINFYARSYSEIYYNLVFFELGLSYSK